MTTDVVPYVGEAVELGTLRASSPADVLAGAAAIATPLAHVIEERRLFNTISGRRFVRVEGWTTLAAMLGVLPREISVEDMADGGYLATVALVRIKDGVELTRASALCGMDEPTWAHRQAFARRSMAITRATGKAARLAFSWCMVLAGFEATPAEEMPDEVAAGVARPGAADEGPAPATSKPSATPANIGTAPVCPKCGSADLWDNRDKKASGAFKKNSPDFSCRDKSCNGCIWPPKGSTSGTPDLKPRKPIDAAGPGLITDAELELVDDDLPY